ncbi:hypothetical protein TVAG_485700 [Trichomonas vaginalis G3]|uniref:Uncharacterized protein n=1 Tax=Trichomonas vaginalis (strain ATCC PRA-98 / G3) TaxID=412133 RepID=A2FZT2_TRIV3|nr:armadillo (ARM) repeat-containing protein family [Trichomonas vaginalis G3]EAX89596.1 hypothetical protein TVAG_485700 [Trichomonas vaginalis G3]KAI5517578.1 armadillo (ARM) repeat-containing protein family [Trichomonas vaginalis G3]|eukprot:XP_001302526.1 hypothetical protein [Trichomonas vaginalis G3]
MEDYKSSGTHQKVDIVSDENDEDHRKLNDICLGLIKYTNAGKSLFIISKIAELTQFLCNSSESEYDVLIEKEIPQLLLNLFNLTSKTEEYRPVTYCMIQIYRKAHSTHDFFESPFFIENLIQIDGCQQAKIDCIVQILHEVVDNLQKHSLHEPLSELFSISLLENLAQNTTNDDSLASIMLIAKAFSSLITDKEAGSNYLKFIRANIMRGQEKSTCIMIDMLSDLINRLIFVNETFISEGFIPILVEYFRLFKNGIGNSAAGFISLYLEKVGDEFPIDIEILEKILLDNSIYHEFPDYYFNVSKVMCLLVINNQEIVQKYINSELIYKLISSIDNYTANIQSSIIRTISSCIFQSNADLFKIILKSINSIQIIFELITRGIEYCNEYVTGPVLFALHNMLLLAQNDESIGKVVYENISSCIPGSDISDIEIESEDIEALIDKILNLSPYSEEGNE